jgi:hypothetical protein
LYIGTSIAQDYTEVKAADSFKTFEPLQQYTWYHSQKSGIFILSFMKNWLYVFISDFNNYFAKVLLLIIINVFFSCIIMVTDFHMPSKVIFFVSTYIIS